jgi:hypothetical protein
VTSKPPRSAREWLLVPGYGGGPGTFAQTAARLAALAKPVVVGALNQPGYVAVWRPGAFDSYERERVERTLRNQQAWLDAMLAERGTAENAIV